MNGNNVSRKALIWDPYLDTLGGGERYALTLAECLSSANFEVSLAWKDEKILEQARARFGLDLNNIGIDPALYTLCKTKTGWLRRSKALWHFDVIFWVSDGSVPLLFGKKNLLHYQVPFSRINGSRFGNQIKLLSINKIIVNSKFTESVINQVLPSLKSEVLYPPVAVRQFVATKKQKVILNVGRFVSPSHPKRQDILIEAFRLLSVKKPASTWKLVLAGGHNGSEKELQSLRDQAKGLNIEFQINPKFEKLKSLYSRASIYWHAAGFGVDEVQEPEKVEHFGISTVEAMAAGCVPVVVNKGGQKEIVNSECGYLVETLPQLVEKTLILLSNLPLQKNLAKNAQTQAMNFSLESFCKQLQRLVHE